MTINLVAGDDRQTIIDKINYYSTSTGVDASANGANDIQLDSTIYGTNANFTVVSDTFAADGTQSGFAAGAGNSDVGVNVAGTYGSGGSTYQATGSGAVLSGRAGNAAEGLRVYTTAAAGVAGTVVITNNSLVFQIGANAGQSVTLALDSMAANQLGQGLDLASGGTNQFASLADISILSADAATDALEIIDAAILNTTSMRGTLGAFQGNTLESGINHMRIAEENMVAAESLIRDADMAEEMTTFTRNQIMLQAATAMLAQSNSAPQVVLSLLG